MIATARHQRILRLLREEGVISTCRLRDDLGVTAMTVWRDLKLLEELGLLRRVRGGARGMTPVDGEPEFEAKDLRSIAAKQRIAALAAREFINEGDTIALEGGTTVAALVEYLPPRRVAVLTNSLPVALRLRTLRPEIAVEVAGGLLSAASGNTTGPDALRAIERWRASVCFLSATGFDAEVGPSDPNPFEIEARRALATRAERVVMLLDASKFGRRSVAVTIHPRRLDALVSDAPPPRDVRALLRRHGVRLLVARHRPAGEDGRGLATAIARGRRNPLAAENDQQGSVRPCETRVK